jgi:hypothetical protein
MKWNTVQNKSWLTPPFRKIPSIQHYNLAQRTAELMVSIVVVLEMPLLVAKCGTGSKIVQDKILPAIIYQIIENI